MINILQYAAAPGQCSVFGYVLIIIILCDKCIEKLMENTNTTERQVNNNNIR